MIGLVTATEPRKPAQGGAIRLNRARKGEIAKALGTSVANARQAGTLPEGSVMVAIAERLAVVADSAWRADNVQVFMSAVTKLSALAAKLGLDDLQLDPSDAGGGDGGDGGGDEPEQRGDVLDRELAGILGSGPALRHSPNARA